MYLPGIGSDPSTFRNVDFFILLIKMRGGGRGERGGMWKRRRRGRVRERRKVVRRRRESKEVRGRGGRERRRQAGERIRSSFRWVRRLAFERKGVRRRASIVEGVG